MSDLLIPDDDYDEEAALQIEEEESAALGIDEVSMPTVEQTPAPYASVDVVVTPSPAPSTWPTSDVIVSDVIVTHRPLGQAPFDKPFNRGDAVMYRAAENEPVDPVMQILPADFPLPLLTRFVPNPAIKAALDAAVKAANSIEVKEQAGLVAADKAMGDLQDAIKNAVEHFVEPAQIADRLHKSITSVRADWVKPAEDAKRLIGTRIWNENNRLAEIERQKAREAQAEADKKARAEAQARADEAAKNQAPPAVVEKMIEQAKTVTAPPVAPAVTVAAPLKNTSLTKTWKARIEGTPAEEEPNPDISDLTETQWAKVKELLADIISGKAPRQCVALDWSYLNDRAKGDTKTLKITGIEAFEFGGAKSKGRRGRS